MGLWNQILLQMLGSLLIFKLPKSTWLNLSNSLPTYTHHFPNLLQCLHPSIIHTKSPFNHLFLSRVETVQYLFQVLFHELLNDQFFGCYSFRIGKYFLVRNAHQCIRKMNIIWRKKTSWSINLNKIRDRLKV